MDYTKLGITPIDEQNKAGEDVRYDEEFEKIEAEISKLTSPTVASEVDWKLVVDLCESILQNKSKHLLVSVYLSYGLFKTRGIEGFADGIKVLSDLLENFWDEMYPPLRRIKGRINALEWMLEKISKALEQSEGFEVKADLKEDLLENLNKIDRFLDENVENAPLFYNLIKLVDTKLFVLENKTEEEPVKEQESPQIQEEPTTQEPQEQKQQEVEQKEKKEEIQEIKKEEKPVPIQTPTEPLSGDLEKDFNTTVSTLNLLIGKMIQAKDYRRELFVINRSFIWLDIEELPASDKYKTMLPPPDTQTIEILEKLYKEENYEDLLWAAESRITQYLFWLDLHFYVAISLEHLGHKDASTGVLEQTKYFIKKLPHLEDLSFSDGTPFANIETKKWLRSSSQPEQIISQKSDTQQTKQIPCTNDGIDQLALLIQNSISMEEKVIYNIELCRCLLEGNNEVLMKVYTHKLLETIQFYKTELWKPSLALEAFLVSKSCLEKISDKEDMINELNEKIALIKPSLIDL